LLRPTKTRFAWQKNDHFFVSGATTLTSYLFFKKKVTLKAALGCRYSVTTVIFVHAQKTTAMTATFTYTIVLAAIYIGRKFIVLKTQAG
jgi:hypothetical protein